ncbi:hypothetical protein ACHAWF_010486 [Thalassiosira exigua]
MRPAGCQIAHCEPNQGTYFVPTYSLFHDLVRLHRRRPAHARVAISLPLKTSSPSALILFYEGPTPAESEAPIFTCAISVDICIMKSKSTSFLHLFVISGIIVFTYDAIFGADQILGQFLDLRGLFTEDRRRLDVDKSMKKRIMEVFETAWPECVNLKMTAIQCKEFIDEEIITTFTERDKYIRVIIKGKRKKSDTWYNTVVVTMDDSNMAVGIDGDGLIQYDFAWEGSGQEATPEQQTEIPPVLATETEAGKPLPPPEEPITDPNDPAYVPQADPTSEEYEPLILEEEPILVVGATVEGAIIGNTTDPIAGGVVIDSTEPNTPEGDGKLNTAIEEYTNPPPPDGATDDDIGALTVPEAGARQLPTFDCEGLTGTNCCLMIKMKVPDADINGNAIQCQLIYQEGSTKEKFWLNSRGKKVFVFANHNE